MSACPLCGESIMGLVCPKCSKLYREDMENLRMPDQLADIAPYLTVAMFNYSAWEKLRLCTRDFKRDMATAKIQLRQAQTNKQVMEAQARIMYLKQLYQDEEDRICNGVRELYGRYALGIPDPREVTRESIDAKIRDECYL